MPWYHQAPKYLYDSPAIWRFTLYWTFIFTGVAFGLPALFAFFNFARKGPRYAAYAVWLPLGFVFIGGVGSFIAATVMGFCLATVYDAAHLRMSTWVPFVWAGAYSQLLISRAKSLADLKRNTVLIVIIGSYSTLTTLL